MDKKRQRAVIVNMRKAYRDRSVRLSPEMDDALQALCEKLQHIPYGVLIRQLIAKRLEEENEPKDTVTVEKIVK